MHILSQQLLTRAINKNMTGMKNALLNKVNKTAAPTRSYNWDNAKLGI